VFALAAQSLAVPLSELCSSVTIKATGGATLKSRSYGYDDANQVTSTTDGSVTTTYGYDLAGQLTSEVRSGYSVAYAYDANGNRTSRTVNSVTETYSYDAADKLLSVSGGSDPRTFGYDAAGRTTSIVRSSGTTTLSYDYESRITSVSGPGMSLSHPYNGLDTRVATTQNSVSRTFKRDGAYVTDPVLSDGVASYTPSISERRGTAMDVVTELLRPELINKTLLILSETIDPKVAVEARPKSFVAGRAHLLDLQKQAILVAVDRDAPHGLRVTGATGSNTSRGRWRASARATPGSSRPS
jgi:YD repeat-containing protein